MCVAIAIFCIQIPAIQNLRSCKVYVGISTILSFIHAESEFHAQNRLLEKPERQSARSSCDVKPTQGA
jgi:hypothetical protein